MPGEGEILSVRDLYKKVDHLALWAKGERLAMARQALDDLEHGASPFAIAWILFNYTKALDHLDRMPDLIRQALQIADDPQEDDPSAEPLL